jgi:hypothetical protein
MILDMVLTTLSGDNVSKFLADHLEEKHSTNQQVPKLITLAAVVAQFGNKAERKIIQRAQRVFMGRHPLGNSTFVQENRPGLKYSVLLKATKGQFWTEFHQTIMNVMEREAE